MSETARIYKNVVIGKNARIGDFVIIGIPPEGKADGELPTVIGDNANIRSHTIIYAGNRIGDNFQTGHGTMLRESNVIADNVSIGTATVIEHHVTMGKGVRVHSQAFIPEFSVLEDDVWIGPRVTLTNAMYPKSPAAKANLQGCIIRKMAKVGANSTLLPGIEIGQDALVGAGAVVTRNVDEGAVVVGNPARVINHISKLPYERSNS